MDLPRNIMVKRVDIKLLNDNVCSNAVQREHTNTNDDGVDKQFSGDHNLRSSLGEGSEFSRDCKVTTNSGSKSVKDCGSSNSQERTDCKLYSNSRNFVDMQSESQEDHHSDTSECQAKVERSRGAVDLVQTHGDRIVWTYNAPVRKTSKY